MLYSGGLTFDSEDPTKFIAAQRFGKALFDRLGIYESMKTAVQTLSATGAPDQVLSGYLSMMREHDTGNHSFTKNEEVHRNLLYILMLDNPSITANVEFKVAKVRIIMLSSKIVSKICKAYRCALIVRSMCFFLCYSRHGEYCDVEMLINFWLSS